MYTDHSYFVRPDCIIATILLNNNSCQMVPYMDISESGKSEYINNNNNNIKTANLTSKTINQPTI